MKKSIAIANIYIDYFYISAVSKFKLIKIISLSNSPNPIALKRLSKNFILDENGLPQSRKNDQFFSMLCDPNL